MFFLLMKIYEVLLKDSDAATVTPVPLEVAEAASEELREPWMDHFDAWLEECVRPTDGIREASTAATVRESFFGRSCCELQKREFGMRLAQQGFQESAPKKYRDGLKTVSKRVYTFKFEDAPHYVTLAE